MSVHSLRTTLATLTAAACTVCAPAIGSDSGTPARAVVQHNAPGQESPDFTFNNVPRPAKNDAAAAATIAVIDGGMDRNSGGIKCLNDGKVPTEQDEPGENFFFQAGSNGGRLLFDLHRSISLQAVRSYSWHPGSRGPQAYTLWVAKGTEEGFEERPERNTNPVEKGWKLVGTVEPLAADDGEPGGQYAVELKPQQVGEVRYLLFEVRPTRAGDPFAHTFFSEIDVIDARGTDPLQTVQSARKYEIYKTTDGQFEFALEVSRTPDLADWAKTKVIPMAQKWYPRLSEMLAGEGFKPPRRVMIVFEPDMRGVADTSGSRVRCAAGWFRENLDGEALGAVFHELVHVVQQYGRRNPTRVPGWLVEGIADYARWFVFEPESKGAEITSRNLPRARYDGNYRISANFLNWASVTYAKDLVPRLNSAIRAGEYRTDLWIEITGKKVEELGTEWRAAMEKKVSLESRVE